MFSLSKYNLLDFLHNYNGLKEKGVLTIILINFSHCIFSWKQFQRLMDSSFGTIAYYRSIIIINNEILLIPWRGVADIVDKTHAKVKGGEK